MNPRELRPEECTPVFNPEAIPLFDSVGSTEDRMAPQGRAVSAIRRGLSIRAAGFHVAVVGPHGTGRTFAAIALAEEEARHRVTPRDLVLLPNPVGPLEPVPVFLPAGSGPGFVRAMEELHRQLQASLHDVLEGPGRSRLTLEVERERSKSEERLRKELSGIASHHGLKLVPSDDGYEFVPIEEQTEDDASSEDTPRYLDAIEILTPHVEEMRRQLSLIEVESGHKLAQRQRERLRAQFAAMFGTIGPKLPPSDEVRTHLSALERHLVETFHLQQGDELPLAPQPIPAGLVVPTLLTSRAPTECAPIVHAQSPTLAGMFGRVVQGPEDSRYPEPGTILAGDLHRANGGILLVEAEALVKREHVYEHLKSCLLARAILPLEEGEGQPLRIAPIELHVKVVLIADPGLISQLQELDPEFSRIFKIRADFAEDMSKDDGVQAYPRFTAWLAHARKLPACDRGAIAVLLRYGARIAEAQDRVTTSLGLLADLITEAAWQAGFPTLLEAEHLRATLSAIRSRQGQLRERILDLHRKGTLRVEVVGNWIGQVNGLAVISDGFVALGRPTRVTAVTYSGNTGPFNIEREVELSGPLHSKGVLILSGYLRDRFARLYPVNFGASVVFEQNYAPVEGDSASTAELFAILSSLAGLPVRQDVAVTGSVDQRGRLLAVGGINEKVEGFFDLCEHLGLTGTQGVIIPSENVDNLVLRDDILQAIGAGRFHVWPLQTVEDGVELLMGVPAGNHRGESTSDEREYLEGTVYGRIERRLQAMRKAQRLIRPDD